MKQKKNNLKSWFLSFLVLFVLLGTVFMVMWAYSPLSKQPEFKIYKEECVDESIRIGKSMVEQKTGECKSITMIDSRGDIHLQECYDGSDYEEVYPCESIKCVFENSGPKNLAYSYYTPKTIVVENISLLQEVWEPIYEEVEVCEQVEVDENNVDEVICGNEKRILDVSGNEYLPCKIGYELTTEWLYENCERLIEGYDGHIEITTKPNSNLINIEGFGLLGYKCKEYRVEVKE